MKKPKTKNLRWIVDSCANGTLRVKPPWAEAPGLMKRLDCAAFVRALLEMVSPEECVLLRRENP